MFNRRRQHGLSIVELIVFLVIVGVAVAGVLQVIGFSSRASADPIRRKQAMLIAEAYMEEIQQAQFTVCDPLDANAATAKTTAECADPNLVEKFGPEPGNSSRPYDNINDYVDAGYVFGTPRRAFAVADSSGNLIDRDVSGNPLGVNAAGGTLGNVALSGITATLTLNDANQALLGLAPSTGPADLNALLITITVTYGTGPNDAVVLQGYRSRYAPQAR